MRRMGGEGGGSITDSTQTQSKHSERGGPLAQPALATQRRRRGPPLSQGVKVGGFHWLLKALP